MRSLRLHRVCLSAFGHVPSGRDNSRRIHLRLSVTGLAGCCVLGLFGAALCAGATPVRASRSHASQGVRTHCHMVTDPGASAAEGAAQSAVRIYLFDANGNPVDVSATYSWHEPHVYDPDEALVGTTDAAGNLYDANLVLIGYVAASSSEPI